LKYRGGKEKRKKKKEKKGGGRHSFLVGVGAFPFILGRSKKKREGGEGDAVFHKVRCRLTPKRMFKGKKKGDRGIEERWRLLFHFTGNEKKKKGGGGGATG